MKKDFEDRMESFFLSETCKYLYLVGIQCLLIWTWHYNRRCVSISHLHNWKKFIANIFDVYDSWWMAERPCKHKILLPNGARNAKF